MSGTEATQTIVLGLTEPNELEKLRAEKAAGEFWRGVFDEITDKTDREKIENELADFHFMMEQVPDVYMHVTGQVLSKCNYYAHSVIAAADEYQDRLTREAIVDAEEPLKDQIKEQTAEIERLQARVKELEGQKAIQDVSAERQRQQSVEGWTPEHDDRHRAGEIGMAAACYAAPERMFKARIVAVRGYEPATLYVDAWPWDDQWWKPKDRRRDLVRAAALIIAEIERIDRAVLQSSGGK